MGIIINRINSYDNLYFGRSITSIGNEPPASEVGVRGPTSNDKPLPTNGSGKDTSKKGDGPPLAPEGTDQTAKGDAEVLKLQKGDAEVRAHEQAHISAGGRYVQGGAKYEYATGPDGRKYAVAGEVSIDTSPIPDDPQATIQKMQVVKRAALAPSQPSPQDQEVASVADSTAYQARLELIWKTSKKLKSPATGGRLAKGTKIDTVV